MGSTRTAIGSVRTAAGAALAGLLGAALLASDVGSAQETAALTDLIFEPVPLADALASPLDFAGRSADEVEALWNAIRDQLAAMAPLREAGSASPKLIEQLAMLAVAYQILDRHEEALAALEEAIALTIQNGGRRNMEQIPLHEQKIPSYLALGDIDAIDETERHIYSLYARSFGPRDRQMYHALTNLADWNLTAYYRENYVAANRGLTRQRTVVPRVERCISIPSSTPGAAPSGCESMAILNGDIKDVPVLDINDARLRRIDRLYTNYQKTIARGGNAPFDIVVDLARRIAQLAYATKQEMDFERDNPIFDPDYEGSRQQAARNSPLRMEESYESGKDALEYAVSVLGSLEGVRPEARAAAMLDLADWHLAYGKATAAKRAYGEVRRQLLAAGFLPRNIDLGLAADLPPRIPVFATHLYSRRSTGASEDAELEYRGYVDVRFTVDGLGNANDVAILGRSGEAARIEALLERQLRSTKFRPVLEGGELHASGRIEARYYYSY